MKGYLERIAARSRPTAGAVKVHVPDRSAAGDILETDAEPLERSDPPSGPAGDLAPRRGGEPARPAAATDESPAPGPRFRLPADSAEPAPRGRVGETPRAAPPEPQEGREPPRARAPREAADELRIPAAERPETAGSPGDREPPRAPSLAPRVEATPAPPPLEPRATEPARSPEPAAKDDARRARPAPTEEAGEGVLSARTAAIDARAAAIAHVDRVLLGRERAAPTTAPLDAPPAITIGRVRVEVVPQPSSNALPPPALRRRVARRAHPAAAPPSSKLRFGLGQI